MSTMISNYFLQKFWNPSPRTVVKSVYTRLGTVVKLYVALCPKIEVNGIDVSGMRKPVHAGPCQIDTYRKQMEVRTYDVIITDIIVNTNGEQKGKGRALDNAYKVITTSDKTRDI